jgi:hypothetical protein
MARSVLGWQGESYIVPILDVAIIVIAVAVTAQAVIMAGALIAGARAWRQVQADVREWQDSLDRRLDAVSARIDEAVVDARLAARSVETLAARADGLVQDAATAAQSVRAAVTVPKALVLTGAASAARWLLSKWRVRHHRALPHADGAGSADVF